MGKSCPAMEENPKARENHLELDKAKTSIENIMSHSGQENPWKIAEIAQIVV